jgi:hypothetical protein
MSLEKFKLSAGVLFALTVASYTAVCIGVVEARYETKERSGERKVDIDRRLERIEDKIDRLIEMKKPASK